MARRGSRPIGVGLQVKPFENEHHHLGNWYNLFITCTTTTTITIITTTIIMLFARYNCLFITCTYILPLVIMGVCYSRMCRWPMT